MFRRSILNGSLDYARRIKSRKLLQSRPENLWKQLPYKSISTLAKDRVFNLPENKYGRKMPATVGFGSVRHLSSTGYNGLTTATTMGEIETSHSMAIQTMELLCHHIMKFQTLILSMH